MCAHKLTLWRWLAAKKRAIAQVVEETPNVGDKKVSIIIGFMTHVQC